MDGLRSMLELNPDALTIAAQRDAERASGEVRGPLHGIPISLKDTSASATRCIPPLAPRRSRMPVRIGMRMSLPG